MTSTVAAARAETAPRRRVPRKGALGVMAYLGGIGLVTMAAARALVARPRVASPPLVALVVRQLDGLFRMGLPLVALVHVPLGSFLAMQAFFMATFREAAGAVVGIGLVRNLAPMMSGFVLAGLLAARIVPELRRPSRVGVDEDEAPGRPRDRDRDRNVRALGAQTGVEEPDPGRVAAVRVLAATIAGPVLAVWGTLIGFFTGLAVASKLLSVSPGIYINKFLEMVEPGEATSFLAKSALFGAIGAILACHEGLRGRNPRKAASGACRAVCLTALAILVLNSVWFTLQFLSGDPFGPNLAVR
jgi:phospholipid/cholesterol/gamma-HCH transport system permease protein